YGYFPINTPLLGASNDSVTSYPGVKYRAIMQSDGNFVVYDLSTGSAVWDAETLGKGARALMPGDGNLVVYDSNGNDVFSTETAPQPDYDAFLQIQDDGNLVMYEYKKTPIWASNSAQ